MAGQSLVGPYIHTETGLRTVLLGGTVLSESYDPGTVAYGNPLTYGQTVAFNGHSWLVQASYGGGADAYALTNYTTADGLRFDRVEVRANDPGISTDSASSRDRAEFQQQDKYNPLDEIWISYALRIKSGFTPTASFNVLGQIHGTANAGQAGGSGYYATEWVTADQKLHVRYRSNLTGLDADYTDHPVVDLTAGAATRDYWYRIVVKIVTSFTGTGSLTVWFDGDPVGSPRVALTGINIGYNDTIGGYFKYGIYRGGAATDTMVVEYANVETQTGADALLGRIASPLPVDVTVTSPSVVVAPKSGRHSIGLGVRF